VNPGCLKSIPYTPPRIKALALYELAAPTK